MTPSRGVLEAGKPLTLTIDTRNTYKNVKEARLHSGAFLIRTNNGLSRPVTVYFDNRADDAKVKTRRANVIYGKIELLGENSAPPPLWQVRILQTRFRSHPRPSGQILSFRTFQKSRQPHFIE